MVRSHTRWLFCAWSPGRSYPSTTILERVKDGLELRGYSPRSQHQTEVHLSFLMAHPIHRSLEIFSGHLASPSLNPYP